jgi:hypothetical protein
MQPDDKIAAVAKMATVEEITGAREYLRHEKIEIPGLASALAERERELTNTRTGPFTAAR